MATYKSKHTGKRVDEAVDKIPENLPSEDSLIVVKADGSASDYLLYSQVAGDKLDKQTAQTETDQIYGKLADGSQTMFDTTVGPESTTIPRRDTTGRVQVADGVSGTDAVNFQQTKGWLDSKLDTAGGIVTGDLTINGDLTVNGTEKINNIENLNVKDAMIYTNAGGTTLASLSGIGIKKDANNVYGIVYDYQSDSVKLGLGKSDANGKFTFNANEGEPVAVRDDSSKLTNDHIIKWDSANHKLVDSGKSVDDFVNLTDEQTIGGKKTFGTETHFNGVTEHYGNVNITDYVLKVLDTNKDFVTQYSADDIVTENGNNTYTRTLPLKNGTFALTSDIADEIAKVNVKNGKGTSSIQQPADPKYNGVIKAATKNPYAKVLYPALTDEEPIGAIGDYAASFGGNSSVQAKRGIGGGTSSVTKGAYSQSLGDNTVTTPNASDSTAIGYQTTTDAPAAFTHGSYAVVMSQKYVEGMFDPNVEPGQGGSGQPTEPGNTPADTLEMDTRRGEAASAGGFNCYSSGFAAETDGVSNVADGHISKSSGRSNRSWSYLSKTDGKNSVVKPDETDTNATGEGSWANGDNVQIIGAKYAYAGGTGNTVYKGADNSFSYGEGLQTKNKNQTVIGQYNDSNNPDEIFGIGVGTSVENRKTSFRATKNGKVYYGDFEVSNQQSTNNAITGLDNKLTVKIGNNTTEISKLWTTIRDTNSNLNRLNETKFDKSGGAINGSVTITGNAKVNTAPTADTDVVRKLELDALKAELQAYIDNSTARYVSTSILGG